MAEPRTVAARLVALVEHVTGEPVPLRLRAWDGSEAGDPSAPVLVLKDRRALRRLLWSPNELGLGRAYVAGEITVDGDLYSALDRVSELVRQLNSRERSMEPGARREILRTLISLRAVGPAPTPPAEESKLSGTKHSVGRDRAAISHHYDVGNDFYRLVLGESMVYSCAYWTSAEPGYRLEHAQRDKLDLICRKLALEPDMRILDVGCGWGSLVLHAAQNYGVNAIGITLSREQAEYARARVSDAGLDKRVEIRVQDYRHIDDGPFDAIASIGMAEHVGLERFAEYSASMYRLLRSGGRLLNHQIAALHPGADGAAPSGTGIARWRSVRPPRSFIDAYVFPDGQLVPLGTTAGLLEEAGFEVRDVEALREHYNKTLRAWVANLDADWDRAVELTSPGRARVWRLYMAGSALSFEQARLGVNQILAVKAKATGESLMPPVRAFVAGGPRDEDTPAG
ncbi:MAG TPA: class I SAM-dependent methyltransferase [Actinocrinis sp.]|jgi:cyclopropane-fatty-acyl-phospholipid synthase